MIDVYINDNCKFYEKVKKYINKKNILVHFLYKSYDIIDDSILKKNKFTKDIIDKIRFIQAINIKDKKKRYSYIYDIVCDDLDKDFINNNICGFEDNICISVKNKSHCKESKNGCCYGTNRGLCKNFYNGKCNIKSISCKLFTCRYLRKNKIKYKINDIPLLKYFFNIRQKFILDTSIFKDKDEILELLLKNK